MGGKRPRSSMSPSIILKDGSPYFAVGSNGGPLIIGTVFNIIVRSLMYNLNIQKAVNAPIVWGLNWNKVLLFEQTYWEMGNINITDELIYKFGYNGYFFRSFIGPFPNAIKIGDNKLLYCGASTIRWASSRCIPVCNSTDGSCPFAMTTIPPQTTVIVFSTLNEVCMDEEDYTWSIQITFVLQFSVDHNAYTTAIRDACKIAFYRTILMYLVNWNDDYCFDLNVDDFMIEIADDDDQDTRRRRSLLQTSYQITSTFEYNDDLQDRFFGNNTLYDSDDFNSVFAEELVDVFVEEQLIDSDTTAEDIKLSVSEPEEIDDPEPDHKIEGALVNAVVIIALVDILIFAVCCLYVYREIRPRAQIEGDIDWKDALKQHRIPWSIVFVEIFNTLIHWIFAIYIITIPTYLGWIAFCLLLGAEIVLYIRYMLYKQLILYQVPKLRKEIENKNELDTEIKARRYDIGITGLILATVEDLPMIIIALIVGENFGYNALEILSILTAIISIIMKGGLLIGGLFMNTEEKEIVVNNNNDDGDGGVADKTKKEIELAEETKNNDKGDKQETDGKPEEEEEATGKDQETGTENKGDQDGDGDKTEEPKETATNKEYVD